MRMRTLAAGRKLSGWLGSLRHAAELVRAALEEIFDESAYGRFLERRGTPSSRAAYAEFLREGQVARERRPRCC